MRFLVLDADGIVGHVVCLRLAEMGHSVSGLYWRGGRALPALQEAGVELERYDPRDLAGLAGLVSPSERDVLVNCERLLIAPCGEDPADAMRINALLPHFLERVAAGTPCRVFQLSTDCVFAGNTGPYSECSVPDGSRPYDLSMAAGELCDPKNLTLRMSIVGPDPDPAGTGLLNWFMAQIGPVRGFSGAMWTGLTTLELARVVSACGEAGTSGLVHMVPPSSISKLDLLRLFSRELRGGEVEIDPEDSYCVDKTLLFDGSLAPCEPAPYEEQVAEMAAWARTHAELYPHYRLED